MTLRDQAEALAYMRETIRRMAERNRELKKLLDAEKKKHE